jgi:hypothetical protein
VWFVLTESSDLREAVRLGINWSPKLPNALGTPAVQRAFLFGHRLDGESVVAFPGTVDFSGTRVVLPGPDFFPVLPGTHAGPVGDRRYSPLFTFGNGVVHNGEQVANATGLHPKVLALDTRHRRAMLRLTEGRYLDRQVRYLSTDAAATDVAALENATYAPNLAAAPTAGSDDPSRSAREAIIPIVNGQRGVDNPQRQGLQSAVAGEGDPPQHHPRGARVQRPVRSGELLRARVQPALGRHPRRLDASGDRRRRSRPARQPRDRRAAVQPGAAGQRQPRRPESGRPRDPRAPGLGVVVDCPPMFVAPA